MRVVLAAVSLLFAFVAWKRQNQPAATSSPPAVDSKSAQSPANASAPSSKFRLSAADVLHLFTGKTLYKGWTELKKLS